VSYFPLHIAGMAAGALAVSESLTVERAYVRDTVLRSLIATLALAAIVVVLSVVLGVALVGKPLGRLRDKARRIGSGDLTGPLELRQNDEIGELATEINLMCAHLAEVRALIASETDARLRTVEQLRHADRLVTVGTLASGIAHEIGTPMSVVLARARMIQARELSPEETAQSGRIIAEQIERISGIVRQLLDFARGGSVGTAPVLAGAAQVDLLDLVQRTIALVGPLAQKRGVTLSVEGSREPVTARGDAAALQQVLMNLVMNALQAMDKPGPVSLTVTTLQASPPADVGALAGSYVRIDVRDHGRGIAAAALPHVFEPFFTTKDIGEGTGLGLSVSYGIVREHRGWIEVASGPGEGSTFSVFLPRLPVG
jgi:signal transduction histidine kinase